MSKKILFQSLLKFRDQIKDGTAKVQDIITDYFNQTGKSVTEEERAIILNEFAKDAPSNVVEDVFSKAEGIDSISLKDNLMKTDNPFSDLVKTTEEGPKTLDQRRAEAEGIKTKYKPVSDKINYPQVEKLLGVKLRGNETFDELLEIEKSRKQGIGSLFPKGKGAAFEKIDDRDEVAEFVRNMRKEGISNPDIRGVFKEFGTDIEGGKRAATTLARAADMGADTKVKQELLSELDEMKMDKGPRFFQEEYMGFDDFGAAMDAKKIEVNNAIVDDLEAKGVSDEDVMFIMGRAREINKKPFYTSGEEFVDIIKEELEFQGIDYDVEFYKKYFRELESLLRKPEPRFMYGGVV